MGTSIDWLFLFNIFYLLFYLIICVTKIGGLFFRKISLKKMLPFCFFAIFLAMLSDKTNNYLISSTVHQGMILLFFFVAFHGEKWKKLGFAAATVSVWEFTFDIISSILGIAVCLLDLSHTDFDHYREIIPIIIATIAAPLTAIFAHLLFHRTKLSEGSFLQGGKLFFFVTSLLLFLSNICGFGITRGIMLVADNGPEHWNIIHNEIFTHLEVIVISVLCLVICLFMLFGINQLISYITTNSVHKLEINRYQTMLAEYKEQVNVRHDMKNHIISMNTLAEHEEWGKLKKYLHEVYSAGILGTEEIETGNSIINAIVNIKKQTAEANHIKFECDINITKPLSINEYDLCVIWGNLLDNALNAASKSIDSAISNNLDSAIRKNSENLTNRNSEESFLYIQAETVKNNLIINVKNSMAQEIPSGEFGIQNYGIGLKNVSKIVQKENGIMNIETYNHIFEISILLPIVTVHDTKQTV